MSSIKHVRDKKGFHVPSHQTLTTPENQQHLYQLIPSDSTAAFGSYFTISLRQKNVLLKNLILQFTVSAISGYTGGTVNFVPAVFWCDRIELVANNNVIDTFYNAAQFISNQLFRSDENRKYYNDSIGDFQDSAQRTTLAASQNDYFVELWGPWKQSPLPMVSSSDLQLRVYMNALSQCTVASGGSGTPAATILLCQALCKQTILGPAETADIVSSLTRIPRHFRFLEYRQMTIQQASGVSSGTYVLSGITGPVDLLYFFIRPTAPSNANFYTFTDISNFDILDSSSASIVGGQSISSRRARLMHGRDICTSTYLARNDSTSFIFLYSFSMDALASNTTGATLTEREFHGNETLRITYTGSLASAVEITVVAHVQSAIEISAQNVRKLSV